MNDLTTYTPAPIAPAKTMGLMPHNIDEALRLADLLSRSSLVPRDYQGNPGNTLVAIQWGLELGLPPLQAMQNIAVINGRPAIWGDALLALVRGSGLLAAMTETVTGTEATCTVTRKGEAEASRTFSLEDAKRAGLAGKAGPWTQYPKRMLQMRARSWALRDVFPDVLRGIHIAEEARDLPQERGMGPAPVVDETPTASRVEAVKAKLAARLRPEKTPAVSDPESDDPVMQDTLLDRLAAAGLPLERVRAALGRKYPARYPDAAGIALDALATDEQAWVEAQLPAWVAAMQETRPPTVDPGVTDANQPDWGDGFGSEGVTA